MDTHLTRRRFLQLGAALGAGVMLPLKWGEDARAFNLLGQGLPLNPLLLTKFIDPLPIPAAIDARRVGVFSLAARPGTAIVSSSMAAAAPGYAGTTVWTYRAVGDTSPIPGSGVGNTYLGPSLLIQKDVPIKIQWYNHLTANGDGTGAPIPHPLPVDPSLHWADPLGDSPAGPYPVDPVTGLSTFDYTLAAVPLVPHVHGGEQPGASDGGPDAWWTPNLAQTGPTFLQAGDVGGSGNHTLYPYFNAQPPATIWYHDHGLGITRLNVYMGLAGAYVITDPDNEPNLGPLAGDIPLVIQDRMFDTAGQLYYPAVAPNPTVNPFWVPEFFGDTILVNGVAWPKLDVKREAYRLRLLNGSNARVYELWLVDAVTGAPGPAFQQIATDGGYLGRRAVIDPALGGKLVIAPGERAEVVVDFSGYAAGRSFILRNSGRSPYPKGAPVTPKTTGQIMQFNVLTGTPVPATLPISLNPDLAVYPSIADPVVKVRSMTLNEWMGAGGPFMATLNNTMWPHHMDGMPMHPETEMPMLGTTEVWEIINTTGDTHPIHTHLTQFQLISRQKYSSKYIKAYIAAFGGMDPGMMQPMGPPYEYDPVGGQFVPNPEYAMMPAPAPIPAYGRTFSLKAGAPAITIAPPNVVGGNPDVAPFLQGPVMFAPPNEQGWKDTVQMNPGEVTRILIRFAPIDGAMDYPFDATAAPGYVWHCHILDHEDNEMMRPYSVMPMG
jgi:FtsP/CotA-like multicopper oxidase with cupredoxin domain